jgi:hypothetical protein
MPLKKGSSRETISSNIKTASRPATLDGAASSNMALDRHSPGGAVGKEGDRGDKAPRRAFG